LEQLKGYKGEQKMSSVFVLFLMVHFCRTPSNPTDQYLAKCELVFVPQLCTSRM